MGAAQRFPRWASLLLPFTLMSPVLGQLSILGAALLHTELPPDLQAPERAHLRPRCPHHPPPTSVWSIHRHYQAQKPQLGSTPGETLQRAGSSRRWKEHVANSHHTWSCLVARREERKGEREQVSGQMSGKVPHRWCFLEGLCPEAGVPILSPLLFLPCLPPPESPHVA